MLCLIIFIDLNYFFREGMVRNFIICLYCVFEVMVLDLFLIFVVICNLKWFFFLFCIDFGYFLILCYYEKFLIL